MGHNEPRRPCLHFLEDRYHTILERRRLQSIPDWVFVLGKDKSRQQQIGNAVPYLLAVAVMGQVYAAATGEEPYRPPKLHGPSFNGAGILASEPESQQQFKLWAEQIEEAEQQQLPGQGYHGVLQQSRQLLRDSSANIQLEQEEQQKQSRQHAVQRRLEQRQQTTTALRIQQQNGEQAGQQHLQQGIADLLSADQQQQQLTASRAASGSRSQPSSSGRHGVRLVREYGASAVAAASTGPGTSRLAEVSTFSQQQARQQSSTGVPDSIGASRSRARARQQQQHGSTAHQDGTVQHHQQQATKRLLIQTGHRRKCGREELGTQEHQQRKQARLDGTSAILVAGGAAAEQLSAQAAAGDATGSRQQAKLRLQEVFTAS